MATEMSELRQDECGTTAHNEAAPRSDDASEYEKEEKGFDKGLKAWLQVLGAFFLWFNSW